MTSTPSRKSQKPQSDHFIEAARSLGCDESEEQFDAALAKVARHKPKTEVADIPKSGKPAGSTR